MKDFTFCCSCTWISASIIFTEIYCSIRC